MFPKTSDPNSAGTPPVPAQEQPPEVNQPNYITKEQFDQAMSQLDQKMANWYKGIQSVDGKVQEKINKLEAAAKAQGVTLTAEQRKLMADTALIQSLDESVATQPNQVPGQVPPPGNVDPELIKQVNNAAETMVKAAQIEFYEDDPEVAIMDAALNKTPKEYLEAVQSAIAAKQTRLGLPRTNVGTPPQEPGAPKSPSLITGVPQSNPIANITDPTELFKLAKF